MTTMFDDVGAFHKKFGLAYFGDGESPQMLEEDVLEFREKFMEEELREFKDAYKRNDLAAAADALVDLVYVALGTAHLKRVPFNECWLEVHSKNMTKVRASEGDARSKRQHILDVVKPEGFVPPDLDAILRRYA